MKRTSARVNYRRTMRGYAAPLPACTGLFATENRLTLFKETGHTFTVIFGLEQRTQRLRDPVTHLLIVTMI